MSARAPVPYRTWLARWERAGAHTFPARTYVVVVYWRDAAGDTDTREIEPVQTLATGFLMDADAQRIKLAMGVFEDGSAREFLAIPSTLIAGVVEVAQIST